MRVLIFGATGMIGQGALRECLLDRRVDEVVTIGRTPTGRQDRKLHEIVRSNLFDMSDLDGDLTGFDGCLFCLGVSSAGMKEPDYRRITFEMPVAAAMLLTGRNPSMTFVYVSGAGADSSERGRVMWARVKGQAENTLLAMPFKAVYVFRPAFVQPMHGIQSKTPLYNAIYRVLGPLYPVWKTIAPGFVTTTEQIGKAMVTVVDAGAPKRVLENADINRL